MSRPHEPDTATGDAEKSLLVVLEFYSQFDCATSGCACSPRSRMLILSFLFIDCASIPVNKIKLFN